MYDMYGDDEQKPGGSGGFQHGDFNQFFEHFSNGGPRQGHHGNGGFRHFSFGDSGSFFDFDSLFNDFGGHDDGGMFGSFRRSERGNKDFGKKKRGFSFDFDGDIFDDFFDSHRGHDNFAHHHHHHNHGRKNMNHHGFDQQFSQNSEFFFFFSMFLNLYTRCLVYFLGWGYVIVTKVCSAYATCSLVHASLSTVAVELLYNCSVVYSVVVAI